MISDLFFFRFSGRAIFIIVCLWSIVVPSSALADDSREYHVKAAFLYHFTQFVEWPETTFSDTNHIKVCLMGSDPFGAILEKALADKHVGNRSFLIVRDASLERASDCHLLFIGKTATSSMEAIQDHLQDSPVLTVGETEEFAQAGGMIQFYLNDKKVRFAINQEAVEKRQLKMSSKLLRLAKIIRSQ